MQARYLLTVRNAHGQSSMIFRTFYAAVWQGSYFSRLPGNTATVRPVSRPDWIYG